ncbi:MAG TPA: response regulator, partial [Gemmataceae bacterium]|nr:response regulator [Gemmataceae bacterium]
MRRRILFVDDEPQMLDELRRMLRPLRDEWDMACVTSGHAALATLIDGSFDVVVTDLQMPGMDGAALLEAVRTGHPHMVRIVLTGPCSREATLRAVRVAHRQLNKPCDPDHLQTTVVRACALRDLLSHPGLRTLMSRLESVPSMPAHYAEVVKELEAAEPSLPKVGRIIAQDA